MAISSVESKWIEFKHVLDLPKTKVYNVLSKNAQARADEFPRLGIIKWYPHWRQYCFFPDSGCVFSRGCMNDINTFIQGLMDARKK